MGSSQTYSIQQQPSSHHSQRVTIHRHADPTELLRIFRLFTHQPFKLIHDIQLETYEGKCWTFSSIKVTTLKHKFNMQNLATIKRTQKQAFIEKQIWYFIKNSVSFFAFLQSNSLALGSVNLSMFPLDSGRYLKMQILHLLPNNQHVKVRQLQNYYSPQIIQFFNHNIDIQQVNLWKSEVFEFGLMLLQLLTCPCNKPKFHSPDLDELLTSQINKRCKMVQDQRSQKMLELISMVLRYDIRTRPDWNYLKIWLKKNQQHIDVAPCIFWSL